MLQNSNFRLPRGHRFQPKSDLTVMAPNHGGKSLGSILGPMGYHWVQKMGQNRRKLPCPKIRIVDYPAVIDFGQNPTLGLWRQITVGPRDHIEANGVPLSPINGSKPWKITMPQNSNFLQPRGHRLRPKSNLTVMAPNHGGETLGSILGQWGPIGSKKWVKTVKNYHAPKFEFSTTPRSSISAKIRPYGYGAKSRWGPLSVHLWANWVPLGPKNGSKP